MNSKLLYILWKSVLYKIIRYHFLVFLFTLEWTGGIVCESAKIDMRQSDA